MAPLNSPAQIRARFVDAATRKFARQVPDFVALRQLVADNGGRFRNDHGAIRTADPRVCAQFERAAAVMGLLRERAYAFPAKKLRSFDLQVIGESAQAFKIFVSEVDLAAFPPSVAALIEQDCATQAGAVDHAPLLQLIEKAEQAGGLSDADTTAFVEHLVYRLMQRNGPPMQRATLDAVAAVSGEAASALALGPDFNHVTIDVHAAGFADVDAMASAMVNAGFRMLPKIQGLPGSQLRQTATMAATMDTPVLDADGRVSNAPTERQFVEIIERGQARNAWQGLLWQQDGQPLIFRNFLAQNAEKIFDAAATRTPSIAANC